jgi:hypothetical protein
VIANAGQMEEPDFMFGQRGGAGVVAVFLKEVTRGCVFVDVGVPPLIVGGQVA